jgi:all-trans-retinol 13,14-reductase
VVYLSFPSAKDPDWSNRYPGKTIDVITLIPYETFEEWAGTMEKKEETLMKLKRRNCAAFIKRSLQTITTSRR